MIKFPFGPIAAVAITVGLVGCASSQPAATPPPAPAAAMSAPQPQPAPPPAPQPTSRQQRIENLQTALNANGANLTVDGRMGPKTVAALRTFQASHNLKVTGRPDDATRKALGIGS